MTDKLNGCYWKTRKQNVQETVRCQHQQRSHLQAQFKSLHQEHIEEREEFMQDFSQFISKGRLPEIKPELSQQYDWTLNNDVDLELD